jgi:hypothetical protein
MRRHIEKLVDQSQLCADAAVDRVQRLACAGLVAWMHAKKRCPSEHRVQRRPQLVRHGGEKLVLGTARRLRLAVQPAVIDRHRGASRQLLSEG